MRLSVRAASLANRCGWCHGDDAPVVPCIRCGATLHAECSAEARRCPTLGCPRPGSRRRVVVLLAAARRLPLELLLWSGAVVGLGLELLALRWWAFVLSPRERPWAGTSVLFSSSNALLAGPGLWLWPLAVLVGALAWRRGARRTLLVATGLAVAIAATGFAWAVHPLLLGRVESRPCAVEEAR